MSQLVSQIVDRLSASVAVSRQINSLASLIERFDRPWPRVVCLRNVKSVIADILDNVNRSESVKDTRHMKASEFSAVPSTAPALDVRR